MFRKSQKNHKLFLSKNLNKLNQKKLAESIKEEAQSITKKSLVKKIDGLQIWLESSSSENVINRVVAVPEGNSPIYANSINGIPAIKFQGESALKINFSAINNSDYTIVIVEQRESSKSDNYILGDPSNTTTNQTLLIGYKTDGSIIHSQGDSAYYTSSISGYSSYNGPRVLIFSHSVTDGNKTYVNGALAGQSNVANVKVHINNLNNLAISKNYIGQIGELIAYNKALSTSEIQSIYDYAINKWKIKVGATKDDCLNGLVTSYSCDLSFCSINIVGISRTQVRGTISSSYLNCDKTGYVGSIKYTCNSKGLVTYPANATCSCATGYSLVNGVCAPITCSIVAGAGYGAKTLNYGSGSFNCEGGIYGTVNYSCLTRNSPTITNNCYAKVYSIVAESSNATSYIAPTGFKFTEVKFASYGVPNCGPAGSWEPDNWLIASCHSSSSNSVVTASCLNKTSCSIIPSNTNFGDPCSGYLKYLAVYLKATPI